MTEHEYLTPRDLQRINLTIGDRLKFVDLISSAPRLERQLRLEQHSDALTAALMLVRDAYEHGWTLRAKSLVLEPPPIETTSSDPEVVKRKLRETVSATRLSEIAGSEFGVPDLARRCENKQIAMLFADPSELATRVEQRGIDAIAPYLQLVENDIFDRYTGIALQDVWRYVRHTSSMTYHGLVGRSLCYIVRDAAGANHPIIGVLAFNNPVIRLTDRDAKWGWTIDGLKTLIASKRLDAKQVFNRLRFAVDELISDTYDDDLAIDPTHEYARIADRLHREAITDLAPHDLPQINEDANFIEVTKTPTFRRKRAARLESLYRAKIEFKRQIDFAMLARTQQGRVALNTAIRAIKQHGLNDHVMDISTCVSAPPYNALLSGKLLCHLAFSRRVDRDADARYSHPVNTMLSVMAGRCIYRPLRLAMLTTTSLYGDHGSAQYNRVRLVGSNGTIRMKRIGKTSGYGASQYASDTISAFAKLSPRRVGFLRSSMSMGRVDIAQKGFKALGLDPSLWLRHHSRRLIYQAELAENAVELALGIDQEPRYKLAASHTDEQIIDYWKERWLAKRVKRDDVLAQIRNCDFEQLRLGREIDDALGIQTPLQMRMC